MRIRFGLAVIIIAIAIVVIIYLFITSWLKETIDQKKRRKREEEERRCASQWRLLKTNKSEIVKHEYRNPKQI